MITVLIRQDFDPAKLEHLSEEARETADDVGELDGNQHYQDLSLTVWGDVEFALMREGELIREVESAQDSAAAELAIIDARDDLEEREALWHLDLGVASAVTALNALGAHTSLSCNGGVFGGPHPQLYPCIRFYPGTAPLDLLLTLAKESDVGLVGEEGRLLLYAPSVDGFQRFAALALARSRE